MTRLQAFAESLTHDILDAGDCHCGTSYVEMKAVAERRIRELARAIDADAQGPAQSYLDEESP